MGKGDEVLSVRSLSSAACSGNGVAFSPATAYRYFSQSRYCRLLSKGGSSRCPKWPQEKRGGRIDGADREAGLINLLWRHSVF